MVERLHPVIDLVRQRRETESRPGKRQDPYKLGLSVEGGGPPHLPCSLIVFDLKFQIVV